MVVCYKTTVTRRDDNIDWYAMRIPRMQYCDDDDDIIMVTQVLNTGVIVCSIGSCLCLIASTNSSVCDSEFGIFDFFKVPRIYSISIM